MYKYLHTRISKFICTTSISDETMLPRLWITRNFNVEPAIHCDFEQWDTESTNGKVRILLLRHLGSYHNIVLNKFQYQKLKKQFDFVYTNPTSIAQPHQREVLCNRGEDFGFFLTKFNPIPSTLPIPPTFEHCTDH